MTPMQKLLWPAQTRGWIYGGRALLSGPVTRLEDVPHLRTPAELISAYGLTEARPYGEHPPFVDVLRFAMHPLMRTRRPDLPQEDFGWPTYENGFLPDRSGIVPVWWLELTRVPTGAEVWRVHADGKQELLTAYAGPALGWRGAKAYFPPYQLVGPKVVWDGHDLVGAFTADGQRVELLADADGLPDFRQTRENLWTREVRREECREIFEPVLLATWRGSRVRILQRFADQAWVYRETTDRTLAEVEGAIESEPGAWQVTVPYDDLHTGSGHRYELDLSAGTGE